MRQQLLVLPRKLVGCKQTSGADSSWLLLQGLLPPKSTLLVVADANCSRQLAYLSCCVVCIAVEGADVLADLANGVDALQC